MKPHVASSSMVSASHKNDTDIYHLQLTRSANYPFLSFSTSITGDSVIYFHHKFNRKAFDEVLRRGN